MNQETANYIMQRMSKYLDNSQMIYAGDGRNQKAQEDAQNKKGGKR